MSIRLVLAALLCALMPPPGKAQGAPQGDEPGGQVGFQRQSMGDGTEIGIWYPASGVPSPQRLGLYVQDVVADAPVQDRGHPLVVISHGTGGDFASHVDTATALARNGFVVAALTHPGDNWRDRSRATRIEERPAALRAMITFMLDDWAGHRSVDPERIGAFGFSAGGFTVLAAAGGVPDLGRLASHCTANPGFFDCTLMKAQPRDIAVPFPNMLDERIKVIVVAAPALGFAFERQGLAAIRIPVQLWRADDDRILPAPFYADAVRSALPQPPEFRAVANAGHFDFLAPCADPSLVPEICQSAAGFDRAMFHADFNATVAAFFTARLAAKQPS